MSDQSQRVFACPWWWVEEQPYTDNEGQARTWFTVRRPNPETVHILGITADGMVPLIRQWRVSYGAWIWELPAGICDVDGEALAATAARELEEETGFRPAQTIHLLRGTVTPGLSDEMWNGFLCLDLEPTGGSLGVHGEQIELHLTPFTELEGFLLAAADRGELLDSKIFGHLLLARRKLAELRREV
jgi:ADP-ribose pyrophosphatase